MNIYCNEGALLTRILKMEMKGFKSFANKTEVEFGEHFNCILGPNGSGKSNVLDSLCFVLGKAGAKGLRVEKSKNLIYNGGKTKKPAKEGMVSIWFDNTNNEFPSFSEDAIKISRIIKSTGQGVYRINDKASTRTQIVDLLGMAHIDPDGYNIILQGDIIRLIEMSPIERRQIVEEIAGINIYEDKKNKALRELGRVEDKINEADIVLAERETYLKELKKDRDQALKYKELEEKKKRNKKTLITNNINKRKEQLEKSERLLDTNREAIKQLNSNIDELRQEIIEKKKEINDLNNEVEEKGETEQIAVHKRVEELRVSIGIDKQRLNMIVGEIEKLTDRQKEMKTSFEELNYKIKNLESKKIELGKRVDVRKKDLNNLQIRITEFRKKHNLETEGKVDGRIDEIDKLTDSIQEEMNKFRLKQQELLREKDKIEMQLQSIDDKLEKLASVKEEHKLELDRLKQKKVEFKRTTMDLSRALSDSSEFAAQLSNARSSVVSRREELAKFQAKKAALMEQLAGSSALQSVLELRKSDPKIYGTVAELGSAQADYGMALEVAAGGKVKSVVVEDDATAAKCIRYVKDRRLGVISLLPMNKIRDIEIKDAFRRMSQPGVHGMAVDLINYDARFAKVFRHVFGNTVVVESIETARKIGIGSVRMVTMTGDIAETSGAMQGGFRAKRRAGGAFGQEEVNKRMEQIERELADKDSVISLLEQKTQDNDALISRLRALKAELEGDIIKTEKSLHLDSDDANLDSDTKKNLKNKLNDLEDQLDDIQDEIGDKNRELAKLKIEKSQLRNQMMELRNPVKLAELQSFEEKKSELNTEIIKLQGDKKHAISEMETIIGPENRKILEIIKQHEKEMDDFVIEQKNLIEKMANDETDLKEKEKQEAKFYAQFKELFAKKSKLTDEVNKNDAKILTHNSNIRLYELKINTYSLDGARIKAELAGLDEEIKVYSDVKIYTDKSEERMKRELVEVAKLEAEMGAVNMRALEIYEVVEKEYHSLVNKKDTLARERTEVLLMINEIDGKKKELFMRTYVSLEDHFKRFFSQLLVKGDAGLVLQNEEDPFAGGVEIKVRLTGSRYLDIRSLSGGEKTMTALAFLFSVQEYEPASFYVLDEVDAALDKKNAQKLAQLVRSYCDRAQYVVISHNDGVIAEADKLYGVSMNEHGISKVTTLDIT